MNQNINVPFVKGLLSIKREDLNHPHISGNKLRKLKYNVLEAKKLNTNTILTFGGAYSNHIAAVAASGVEHEFNIIGVIRGEEVGDNISSNPTLSFAKSCGMQFKFVSRSLYREKDHEEFINRLREEYGDFYLIPEGGTNSLAVKGCEEILDKGDSEFDYICCSVGTGGTISGLINSSQAHQKVIGFPSLKGDFLKKDIGKFVKKDNWELCSDYHFGGYAKINQELISFINQFKDEYKIPLDPVYTGKMMFGIFDLLKKGYFKKYARILAIHTGGLQGIEGMNSILKKKNLPQIDI